MLKKNCVDQHRDRPKNDKIKYNHTRHISFQNFTAILVLLANKIGNNSFYHIQSVLYRLFRLFNPLVNVSTEKNHKINKIEK